MEINYPYFTTGASLGVSIKRKSDNKYFDFVSSGFMSAPTSGIITLVEGTGSYSYLYSYTIVTPSAVWTNDDYPLFIHLRTASDKTIDTGIVTIYNGSDGTVIPDTGVVTSSASSVTQVTVTGYIAGQDPRSQLYTNANYKLAVDSAGGVTTNSVALTGAVNINFDQLLPTGEQIVPFSIGDSLSLTVADLGYGVIRPGIPRRNVPIYRTR